MSYFYPSSPFFSGFDYPDYYQQQQQRRYNPPVSRRTRPQRTPSPEDLDRYSYFSINNPHATNPDPYIRALSEEQAARNALQEAIAREQEAKRRRAVAEAEAHARAQARARAEAERLARERALRQRQEQARARPRSVYGWSGLGPYAFGYEDEEDLDEEEEQYQPEWTPFGYRPSQAPALRRRVRSDMDEVPEPRFYRQPTSPKRQERTPSPVIDEEVPNVSIPVSSPPRRTPTPPSLEQIDAATTIQTAYRLHLQRRNALQSISQITSEFDSLKSDFTFPTQLDFDPSASTLRHNYVTSSVTDEDRPPLAYSHNNVPVHGYEDDLLKLLQKLDAVESGGEKAVRDKRRAVVKRIEEELVWLDEKVRSEWAKWQGVNAPVQQRDEEEQGASEEPMAVDAKEAYATATSAPSEAEPEPTATKESSAPVDEAAWHFNDADAFDTLKDQPKVNEEIVDAYPSPPPSTTASTADANALRTTTTSPPPFLGQDEEYVCDGDPNATVKAEVHLGTCKEAPVVEIPARSDSVRVEDETSDEDMVLVEESIPSVHSPTLPSIDTDKPIRIPIMDGAELRRMATAAATVTSSNFHGDTNKRQSEDFVVV